MHQKTNKINPSCKNLVRSPGFEPGLSGWEPDVLTKLDYDRFETSGNNQRIHELLIALESSGLDKDSFSNELSSQKTLTKVSKDSLTRKLLSEISSK